MEGKEIKDGEIFEELAEKPVEETKPVENAEAAAVAEATTVSEGSERAASTDSSEMSELKSALGEMKATLDEIKNSSDKQNEPKPPMKWFNFLIYFLLFASALLNFISGVMFMTGYQYVIAAIGQGITDTSDVVKIIYTTYGGLHALDLFFGIMTICIAVFTVVTRFMLSSYRKLGPIFLIIAYGVMLGLEVIYIVGTSAVIGQPTIDASVIGNLIGSAVMIIVNFIYFNKRKKLFVK